MEVNVGRGAFFLDPRTKMACVFSAGCLLVGTIPPWAEAAFLLIGALLLLNYFMGRELLKFMIVLSGMILLEIALRNTSVNGMTMFLLLMCQLMRRFIPCLMAALVFVRTTTISEWMASVQKMHLPYKAAVPFAVVIRFFPTFKEEYENIKQAMKMRGIRFSLEHILVPMLHSALNISDELSAAALSRGLGSRKQRTYVCKVHMGVTDWLISTGVILLAVIVYIVR